MTKVTDGNLTDSLKYLAIIASVILIVIGGTLIIFIGIVIPLLRFIIPIILKSLGIELVI